MKYETPQMTVLTPAINAIQTVFGSSKIGGTNPDSLDPLGPHDEVTGGYKDWE